MKKIILLVLLTLSIFAFDTTIDSITIIETPKKEVTINKVKFESGVTYMVDFLNKEAKEAIEKAVVNHNPLIKSVTFKKVTDCYSLTGAWIGDTPYCEAHKSNWVK